MAHLFFRRTAAMGLVASAGACIALDGLGRHGRHEELVFLVAGAIALAAVGIGRRALLPQVLGRGAVWAMAAASAYDAVVSHGTTAIALALAFGGALLLTRPLLASAEEQGFAPLRFRRLLLAGATAMGGIAFVATVYAIFGLVAHNAGQLVFNTGLAAMLAASVAGLLRMRAWGVLLGAATSLACLAIAPFYGRMNALTLSVSAIPALAFWLVPILVARSTPARPEAARYRVALPPETIDEADELAFVDTEAQLARASAS